MDWSTFITALLAVASIPTCQGGFITKPRNVAAVRGSTVTLICRGESSDAVLFWQKSSPALPKSFVNVALNQEVYLYPERYKLNFDYTTFTSTLTINNVQQVDSGTFVCNLLINSLKSYAQLVVLDSKPSCSSPVPIEQAVVGDTLAMACKVGYSAGFAYAPTMAWTLAGKSIIPSVQSTANEALTTHNIAVTQELIGQQFQVVTTFPAVNRASLPDSSWDHDLTPPTYRHTYTSAVFSSPRQVTQVTFSPQKATFYIGETITCQSDGNPPTTKRWTNGASTLYGDSLSITDSMSGENRWTCIASHDIRGTPYSMEKSLSFMVMNSFVSSATLLHFSYLMSFICISSAILLV